MGLIMLRSGAYFLLYHIETFTQYGDKKEKWDKMSLIEAKTRVILAIYLGARSMQRSQYGTTKNLRLTLA